MQSSKINELRESTFREGRKRQKRDMMIPRIPSSGQQYLDPKILMQYELKLPHCPFHHQPIRYLCLKQDCKSSSFGACNHQECKSLHSDPNSDFIELNVFNDVIRESVSSLQILASKMKSYFREVKQKIIHQIDRSTQKVIYLIENVYTLQVPRLIRQKKHSQINSYKLGNFVRRQLSEGVTIRLRMQALRNQVSDRIKEREKGIEKLQKTKEYEHLLLGDIINIEEEVSFSDVSSKIQVKDFKSSIMEEQQQLDLLLKFLRENRAIGFSKMTLLFKGSENQFNSDFFHQKVDGVSPTLLFVKTTKGMKFGGYLNWKFNNREDWISDVSGLSFLFSIDRKESYRLKSEAQCRFKAAFGGQTGIQIGSGCDLYLCEDCNVVRKSGSNLGGSYRLPGHLEFNSPQSRSYIAGQQYFLVEEYEIFHCQ